MDTRQLETLLAIQQHGGFAAAAAAVHLTASAVSQQVAALEAELGEALFDRRHRPPVLTAKGAEMVRAARAILQIVTETKSLVSGDRVRGTFAFGTLRTAANSLVPNALALLHDLYPDLGFRLRIGMSEELMDGVMTGQMDAALVADHVSVPPSLRWTEVVREPLVVLVPPGTGVMTMRELVWRVPYIRYRMQVPLARQIDTEMARLDAPPRQIVSVNTMTAVVGCVRAGLGFAVIPRLVLQDMGAAALDWFPFGDPPIHRSLGIVQRPGSGRAEVFSDLISALTRLGLPRDDKD